MPSIESIGHPLVYKVDPWAVSFPEIVNHAGTVAVRVWARALEGSALRGDMLGGVKPVELSIEIEADAAHEIIVELVKKTEMTSAPQAYMRNIYENTFSLCLKGQQYPVRRVTASPNDLILYSAAVFDAAQPLPDSTYEADIITKQSSAATIFDLEGGVGSSLQSEQKRTLHARSVAMLLLIDDVMWAMP